MLVISKKLGNTSVCCAMFNITASILVNILILEGRYRKQLETEFTRDGVVYNCSVSVETSTVTLTDLVANNQSTSVYLRNSGTFLSTVRPEDDSMHSYEYSYESDYEDHSRTEEQDDDEEGKLGLLTEVHLDFETTYIESDVLRQLLNLRKLTLTGPNPAICSAYLRGLQNLHSLKLEKLHDTVIPGNFFSSQHQVRNLEYVNSALQVIEDDAFTNMTSLETLELQNNHLVNISSGSFRPLKHLLKLNLSRNQLLTIPVDLFNNLERLRSLQLSSNLLGNIANGTFRDLKELSSLALDNNKLENLPAGLFSDLQSLAHLQLNNNLLTALSDDTFTGCIRVDQLDLEHNQLSILTGGVFRSLPELRFLQLSYNQLEGLPENLLSNQHVLLVLELSHNMLQTLPAGLFANDTSLHTLDAESNAITSLPRSLLPLRLRSLNFNNNRLQVSPLMNAFWINNGTNPLMLRSVHLKNNSISSFGDSSIAMPVLRYLDFSHNNISQLSPPFWSHTRSASLDFSHNRITHIICDGCSNHFSQLILDNNPIICDLHLMDLLKEIQLNHTNRMVQGTCAEPVEYQGQDIGSLQRLDAPHSKGCPAKCECKTLVLHTRQVEVNCTGRGLVELPDMTQLNINYEKIIVLASHNRISSITEHSLRHCENVATLDVAHNQLERFAVGGSLRNLKHLDISANRLYDLHSITQFAAKTNVSIKAGGNRWSCQCEDMINLYGMIQYSYTIMDMEELRCSTGEQLSPLIFPSACNDPTGTIILATVSTIVLVVAVTSLTVYHLRVKIKAWLCPLTGAASEDKVNLVLGNAVPVSYRQGDEQPVAGFHLP